MVERLSEQILRRWENFTAKWRLLYYKLKYEKYVKEKGRRRREGNSVQQTPHPSSFSALSKQRFKHRNHKRRSAQSNPYFVWKQDDCWTINKDNKPKWEGSKRWRKKLANRDTH